jgi:putative ABC transport system permease protein
MGTLIQDMRYALRTLLKSPGFVAIAVLTLALGIGANVAIFALVNAVLLQPLPFQQPDRMVRIFDDLNGAGARDVGMSVPEFEDLRQRSGVFEHISALVPASVALTGGDRAERIEMLGTSPGYFQLLGAKAAVGRVYGDVDWVPGFLDGIVISDGLWKRQFGADPGVIGRRVRLDEDGYTIIGVMPAEFRHPGRTLEGDVEIWAATGFVADPFPSPPIRSGRLLPGAMGRLERGLTVQEAQQRLDAMVADLQRTYAKDYPAQSRWSLRIQPVEASLTGNVRPTLVVLLAAVSFVLLIVCVNIASLLIARSSARTRELAIRRALGASRGRLVRQLLTESVLISLAGGVAAIVVLQLSRTSLVAMMPADLPRLSEVHFNSLAVDLALALSFITGILSGVTPALQATATDPNHDLKEGGRGGAGQSVRKGRFRAALVSLEIALSVVLLIGAGLLVRSFSSMLKQNPGLDPTGLTVGQIWIPVPNNPQANRYLNAPQRAALVRELLRQMSLLPGVQSVALGTSTAIPFLNNVTNPVAFSFSDDTAVGQNDYAAEFGAVSPDYFEVLKTPLKHGRVLTDQDSDKTASVVVVNEAFVRKFSQHKDLIGKRLRDSSGKESQIVGVVEDVRDQGLDMPTSPRVYSSIFQSPGYSLSVFLRTRSDAGIIKAALTRTVNRVNPELPVFGVRTINELMSASMARRRFALALMAIFAGLALFLAALGIYGVMAFVVSQRTQEFGVRMALGAQQRDILLLAFRPGLVLTSIGTVAGLAVSIGAMRLMSSLLFGVSPSDPFTFAGVPIVLGTVALIACWLPAWRATHVPPSIALRS